MTDRREGGVDARKVRQRLSRRGTGGYIVRLVNAVSPAKAGCLRRTKDPTLSAPTSVPVGASRVVICDYNQLLQSVTGLLRISGYAVFQAYDGEAAEQLCEVLPDVRLLILNTDGTGIDTPGLVRSIREHKPGLSVLHIGTGPIPGMPNDVPTLSEQFTVPQLLAAVERLVTP